MHLKHGTVEKNGIQMMFRDGKSIARQNDIYEYYTACYFQQQKQHDYRYWFINDVQQFKGCFKDQLF